MIKITVIIPAYNSEDVIVDCIKSLVYQKGYKINADYKIILVDDGSTDKTVEYARRFPVEIIRVKRNRGRIAARLTGAENAETDRILFVDTRVVVRDDFLEKAFSLNKYKAVIGELHSADNKYKTIFDNVFYLVRRKYYGKNNFPLKKENLIITKDNIKRAPKGTAVLLIERELFVSCTPDRVDRNANDDTLLFHKLVVQMRIPLLRTRKLYFYYSQRTKPGQFIPWLFDRGTRFSDFYFRPGGYLFYHFIIIVVVLLGMASLILLFPDSIFSAAAAVIAIHVVVCLWLSENIRDFFTVFSVLPFITLIFGLGVCKFWFLYIKEYFYRMINA